MRDISMALKDCLDLLPKVVRLPFSATVVAISYYLCAKLGLSLSFKPDYIAALWPPNSILLTALFLTKPKAWPWFLLAAVPAELAADLPSGIPLSMALGFVGADWIEVLTAAIILRKFTTVPPEFNKLRQTTIYIICCALAAPFVAAFPGAVVTGIGQGGPDYITRWSRWLLGDSLTHLLITPFIILWLSWKIKHITSRSLSYYIELISLASILLMLSIAAFSGVWLDIKTYPEMIFAPLPILLWVSVRFSPHGAFSTSVFFAIASIWLGSKNMGPFVGHSAAVNVFNLQAFLIIALTPLLFLTSLIEEHRRSEEKLRESELKYRTLFESSIDALSIIEAESGKIVDCNDSAVKLHGTGTRKAFLGLTTGMLSPDFQPGGDSSEKLTKEKIKKTIDEGSNVFEWTYAKHDGRKFPALVTLSAMRIEGKKNLILVVGRDLTELKEATTKREQLIKDLKGALAKVKTLSGMLPICSACKKVRDDKGYWKQIESYISEHSEAVFSHGMCPECTKRLYPDLDIFKGK